ncbi:hypothetical protein NDU88_007125 [Pleurodeles waltl]|uniref:Uncharacterized protein n=1 Tax=Pleurodeles waltl TaxID=8319 RepID=A0AAV7MF30_PLEWA|nr:hypothetical protein NDU88_007125 [Pleurodeles waltl]
MDSDDKEEPIGREYWDRLPGPDGFVTALFYRNTAAGGQTAEDKAASHVPSTLSPRGTPESISPGSCYNFRDEIGEGDADGEEDEDLDRRSADSGEDEKSDEERGEGKENPEEICEEGKREEEGNGGQRAEEKGLRDRVLSQSRVKTPDPSHVAGGMLLNKLQFLFGTGKKGRTLSRRKGNTDGSKA